MPAAAVAGCRPAQRYLPRLPECRKGTGVTWCFKRLWEGGIAMDEVRVSLSVKPQQQEAWESAVMAIFMFLYEEDVSCNI